VIGAIGLLALLAGSLRVLRRSDQNGGRAREPKVEAPPVIKRDDPPIDDPPIVAPVHQTRRFRGFRRNPQDPPDPPPVIKHDDRRRNRRW